MKRSIVLAALAAVLAAGAVVADQWRTETINVNTNQMTLTLGNEYRQPCRLEGFWTAPSHVAAYTNQTMLTVTRGRYVWYSLTSYPTNAVLRVSGLDLPVQYGDVITFTNNYATGKLYLHFRTE